MRFVIYGAGAIGATIGARLHLSRADVTLIARGRHLEALAADGLRLQTPDGEERLRIDAVGSPAEAEIGVGDTVILAVKTQDSLPALEALVAAAPSTIALVCAQNGVENERLALRRFSNVYGMFVQMPAQHLEPGVVQSFASPTSGILDLGRAPSGSDEQAQLIAAVLAQAGFASQPREDIMRWKYSKLLSNLGNAVEVLFGPGAHTSSWAERARREGLECYAQAGIAHVDEAELNERVSVLSPLRPAGGVAHTGGSTWQSIVRRAPSIESDYLNGEIVLLGRIHGVPTPVNAVLAEVAGRMARNGEPVGSANEAEVEAAVAQLAPTAPFTSPC